MSLTAVFCAHCGDGDRDRIGTPLRSVPFASPSVPPVSLITARSFHLANGPSDSVAIADFDGDGRPDLVVADRAASVFFGQGNGSFGAPTDYVTPMANINDYVTSVAAGDLTGDGKPDILAANQYGDRVELFANTGSGAFAAPVYFTAGQNPSSIATGDFDGDGKLDFAVASQGRGGAGNVVSVFLNGGSAADYSAAVAPSAIASADMNGDGKLDLVVASKDVTALSVCILTNNGDGSFAAAACYAASSTDFFVDMTVGDVNGDGKPDVVTNDVSRNVAGVLGGVSVLVNQGDGTLGAPAHFDCGGAPVGVRLADLDGDAKLDLIAADWYGYDVCVRFGDGTGSFGPPLHYIASDGPYALATGDLDGDGHLDVVVTQGYGVSVLMNMGSGRLHAATAYPAGQSPYAIAVADFNGDGKSDLALANSGTAGVRADSSVSVLANDGAGHFPSNVEYAAGGHPQAVAAGDFDGDGKADLAVANYNNYLSNGHDVSILINHGDGSYAAAAAYDVGPYPTGVAAGDLDGDGKLDLAVVRDQAIVTLHNRGDGTFAPAVTYATETFPRAIAVADLNGDGKADVAVAGGPTLSVYFNDGSGTFAPAATYRGLWNLVAIAAGDLDGDGKADIAAADSAGGGVVVLASRGGGYPAAVASAAGIYAVSLVLADLNHDGVADIVLGGGTAADDSTLFVLPGVGDGSFAARTSFSAGSSTALGAGDFDGDGKTDVAVAAGYGFNILINDGP